MNVVRDGYTMYVVNELGLPELTENPDAGASSGNANIYVSVNDHLPHFKTAAGVDHVMPLSGSDLPAGSVTPSKVAQLLRSAVITGGASAGSIAFTGAAVGDIVQCAIDLTDLTDVTTDFEATISVAGAIQQTGGSLSTKKILVLLQRQS